MRGDLNDSLRCLIGLGIAALGAGLETTHRARIRAFPRHQQRLRQRYGVTAAMPVLAYGPQLERLIRQAAERIGTDARFALTSGSTAEPKRILYDRKRLRAVRWTFMEVYCRCCRALSIRRKTLFIFSPPGTDQSLTSMLLAERGLPPYLSTLQAPYRVQSHPAIQSLTAEYGTTAVRLWLLALANPGVLYSTNPSTISTFLDQVAADWQGSSRLAREWAGAPAKFELAVRQIARRLESRGAASRIEEIAASEKPLPLCRWAPGVEAYICWTGGYVQPFLDRLAVHMPPDRYRLIPMYSMSTETVETVSHFEGGEVAFLPLAPGVLYEFIEEGDDKAGPLRTPDQLQKGKRYTLVVSDAYGLRRYQTDDIFLVRGFVAGLPDLRFRHRRGLEYSFTGEKLTADHLSAVFRRLREEFPGLPPQGFLTCIPSRPPDERVPHYKILLVGGGGRRDLCLDALASRCDALLAGLNGEYASKRRTGRLGPIRCLAVNRQEFVERVGGSRHRGSWEGQFKFLPLYRRTWESMDEESGEHARGR